MLTGLRLRGRAKNIKAPAICGVVPAYSVKRALDHISSTRRALLRALHDISSSGSALWRGHFTFRWAKTIMVLAVCG